MSNKLKQLTDKEMAQYLDQDVPLQQIEQLSEFNLEPSHDINLIDLLIDFRRLDDEYP